MKAHNPVLFTILLPIHRNVNLLPFSVESVLAQSISSFELFIICDGVSAEISQFAHNYATQDNRIRVFNFPKGKRFGEIHRHHALMAANGKFIAGIADDDLWFPNHLEELEKLLNQLDFGNLLQTEVDCHGHFTCIPGDLADRRFVEKMLNKKFNFFGPTACGYRLTAYHKLCEGWSPAPENIWTDLYMWRKFLSTQGLEFGSRMAVTSLHFSTALRQQTTDEKRALELKQWAEKIKCSHERDLISQKVIKTCVQWTNKIYLANRLSRKLTRLLVG